MEGAVLKDFDRVFWKRFVDVCAFVNGDAPGPYADAEERRRWQETADRIVDDLVASPPFHANVEERRRWQEMAERIVQDLVASPPFTLATAPRGLTSGMEMG